MPNNAIFILCVNVKIQLYAKGFVQARGWGKHFSKTFSIFYMLNSRNSFQPIFLNRYLYNEKHIFADDSRVETTILSM